MQARYCSTACRRLPSAPTPLSFNPVAGVEGDQPARQEKPLDLVALLDVLPLEVVAVEIDGWRLVRL
jgi:hypothetical protein